MKKILTAALIAAATTAASWAVTRWLSRAAGDARPARRPLETWENEGGSLAPAHVAVETSQVPR